MLWRTCRGGGGESNQLGHRKTKNITGKGRGQEEQAAMEGASLKARKDDVTTEESRGA